MGTCNGMSFFNRKGKKKKKGKGRGRERNPNQSGAKRSPGFYYSKGDHLSRTKTKNYVQRFYEGGEKGG